MDNLEIENYMPVVKQNRGIRSQYAIKPGTFTVATLPTASTRTGALIYVSNGAAGAPVIAFSNGTNWLRVDTLAAVSAS